jgi:4-amino-4-deoxy-L-arabinose transferase-like glycosyltransferase
VSRKHVLVGVMLAIVTTVLLALGHRDVGYARDEGIYFEASRRYAAWVQGDVPRDQAFAFNSEHPVLMKTAAGLSARLFAHPPVAEGKDGGGVWPVMPEGAAMRLPAQIVAGLGVGLLFVVGAAWAGPWAGLFAAGWFILLPHVAFHAGLHAFDVPIAVMTLVVALAYRAGLRSRAWGLAVGPIFGVAIAVKHNALFLGPLFAVHYAACLLWAWRRHGRPIARAQWLPLPLLSMAILGPLVAWALWPWMWTDTLARLGEYLQFHREHSWYNMEFLGVNYNQPPMPVSYPIVMTWATVPTVLLVLSIVGLATALRRDFSAPKAEDAASPRADRPLPEGWSRLDGVWLLLLGLFPIALIASPNVPIFGGTKHWLTAYPFLALAAAIGLSALWSKADLPRRYARWLPAAVLLLLLPSAWATVHGHPRNLSQYAPLVGGARGAADLGLNRGFWGYDVRPLLPTIADARGPVYLHDIHELARRQYVREGALPQGVKSGPAHRARTGLLFHELHMAIYEYELWDAMGTAAPAEGLALDDVPTTSLYAVPAR